MSSAVIAVGAVLCAALTIPDFELPDPGGNGVPLSAHAEHHPVVLVFVGTECPLANLYAQRLADLARQLEPAGVRFLAIDPLPQDGSASIARFAREHRLPFPIVHDPDARVAARCGVTRTPQVVLLDVNRRVRYRGRIDDQYEPNGKNRGKPTRHDLAEAIRELLAGKAVSVPVTPTFGCLIPKPQPVTANATVTYHRDIAPIFQAHCQVCHRPREVAPFALLTYDDARHWGPMIAEVVANGSMPPWHANPEHGNFHNARRLTGEQKKAIQTWADAGCPEGDPAHVPTPKHWPDGWAIGTPDLVLKIPKPFRIPAEGVIDYQHAIVDPHADHDLWVTAAEIRPGNRRVLHHCNVYLHPPEAGDSTTVFETTGPLGSVCFMAYTPGTGPLAFPPGVGFRIPAGWKLHLSLHYSPIGIEADDQTELGLVLADPAAVHREAAVKAVDNRNLLIPPGAVAYRTEQTWTAEADYDLLSLLPHMHLRGKSFRYAAEFPDGRSEVLLDVPAYDFNWQHRYELAEPKRLPAGTVLRCTAEFDNSASNPANPDPTAEVRYGPQSTDEMCVGYFEVVLADQDLQTPAPPTPRRANLPAIGTVLVVALLLLWKRRSVEGTS